MGQENEGFKFSSLNRHDRRRLEKLARLNAKMKVKKKRGISPAHLERINDSKKPKEALPANSTEKDEDGNT